MLNLTAQVLIRRAAIKCQPIVEQLARANVEAGTVSKQFFFFFFARSPTRRDNSGKMSSQTRCSYFVLLAELQARSCGCGFPRCSESKCMSKLLGVAAWRRLDQAACH